MQHAFNPEVLGESPLAALGPEGQAYRHLLELLPAAVYTCAAPSGVITYYNERAATLWGRAPRPGDTDERFCGSFRLFRPDGQPLPHDQTPMAAALFEGRAFRNEEVVIERPDGTRVTARVSIDPIRDATGQLVGAINVFQDVTDHKGAERALAHLAAIVASSDDAIVAKNLDGTITSWNAAAERIFGYSAAEAIGRSITLIIPSDRLDEETSILERLRRGERIDHYETIRRRSDGTLIDISITVSPIRDGSGRIVGASKIARDITAQKLAEKVRVEEGLVRETLARVGATLAAELDQDKLVQAITDATTTLTGAEFGVFFYNVTDDGGDPLLYTVSGRDRESFAQFPKPRVTEILAPTLRGEGPIRLDDVTADPRYGQNPPHRGVPADHLPVRSYLAVPVTSRSGEVLGGLLFGHSRPGRFQPRHEQLAIGIASSAAIAFDNARLYREAQDANRLKDEFLATLSHELRTPLNAMLGWAHMLRSMTLPPETETRALESLERNARAQAQLVEDLLDVSRIVSGKLQINVEEVDLARVVLEAVESVRPALVAKRLDLELAVPPDLGAIVNGDADRLRQVVWNLLSNAAKFTPAGGQVAVSVRTMNGQAEVSVRDTGIGIPRQFLRHVFERFRQAESTASRRHGGLGLGLAIVRHLTEAHGGTVAAESAGEGHGATFIVRLPVSAMRGHTDRPHQPPRTDTRALSGIRALVVDDEADARDLTRVVLEMHGARVTTASSAGEALHALAQGAFDVLIADIGMPEQDGYSLIQAIRASTPRRGATIPAIAATAYASVRERSRALEAGYDWHLSKPLDPEQLVATVLSARNSPPAR